ncbi:unnamed protein product [Somion occarium]|uniref:Uncharacterized protein n=1 Tax=Somion occarium TaxID=3059160 RepID=A0ABP1D5E9_9APHY
MPDWYWPMEKVEVKSGIAAAEDIPWEGLEGWAAVLVWPVLAAAPESMLVAAPAEIPGGSAGTRTKADYWQVAEAAGGPERDGAGRLYTD